MNDQNQNLETTAVAVVGVRELAGGAKQWFETSHRGGDSEEPENLYVRLRDGAPKWLKDLVCEAHDGMLPDDWRYKTIRSALDCIAEADDPEDAAHEWADAECDLYTADLCAWLGSHSARPGYCDEASAEMGLDRYTDGEYGRGGGEPATILTRIQCGQYQEAREVFAFVLAALEKRAGS